MRQSKEIIFFYRLTADGSKIMYDPSIRVLHVVETSKLSREYMYRVASGIGRGERVRTLEISKASYRLKVLEYLFKLGAAFVLAVAYLLQAHPAKMKPVIKFRIDALKGLMGF